MAIDGTIAAFNIGIIDRAEYEARIDAFLTQLETMQLDGNNRPFYAYRWDSGLPAWSQGMDAADGGRTLNALGFLRRSDSTYASRIDSLLTGRLKPWIDTLSTWGLTRGVYGRDVAIALHYFRYLNSQYAKTAWLDNFYSTWTSSDRLTDGYGNSMPKMWEVNFGPIAYELIEKGEEYDRTLQYASEMRAWAQKRHEATGKYSLWGTEFHIKLADGSTPFAWTFFVAYRSDLGYQTWQVKLPDGRWFGENDPTIASTVSSVDAAYALKAVFPDDPWISSVFPRFTQSDLQSSNGFFDALFEATDSPEGTVSVPHNAVVLMTSPADTPTAPPSSGGLSFFHPATEFWFSRYDMLNAEWDAIHLVNVATQEAHIQIMIGTFVGESLTLPAGEATYRTYPGVSGGPVHIVSDQLVWATQRVVGWTAMQEINGMPGDVSSTNIIFTWYDNTQGTLDEIYVVNPSTSATANVEIRIGGVTQGQLTVEPGAVSLTAFPDVIGGPVEVVSDVPVFASQRVIGFGDFAEIIGLPSWYTFTETWFNWYDMASATWDAIHVLNPGSSPANVEIFIAGELRASVSLPAGAADYRTFPGLMGGPVRVASDQPIWVTQRIVGWDGWKEVFAVPTALASTEWYFTWYDMQSAQWDGIHFINPNANDAQVQVYVGGVLRSTITVRAAGAAYVYYPGLAAGPVRIVSTVPILSSQRVLGWGSFEETIVASLTVPP
jgi:hypothetical protein